jgi:hypothetical protein
MDDLQVAIRTVIRDNEVAQFRMHPAQQIMIEETMLVQFGVVKTTSKSEDILKHIPPRTCGGVLMVADIFVDPEVILAMDKDGNILQRIQGIPVPKSLLEV